MSATEFTADLRDIRFVLHEQLRFTEHVGADSELDVDTADAMLDEAYRLATDVLFPLNKPADVQGCSIGPDGDVVVPEGFQEAWNIMTEGGWVGLNADEDVGGMGMPHTLGVAVGEMHVGACQSFALYTGLTRAASNLLAENAQPELRSLLCEKLNTGAWGATMCLTEAGAGTDVGASRTTATPSDVDGVFHLEGEKIFISSGDHTLTENIVHLVLARLPGAPAGTRGLSIFAVPKVWFEADGSLGSRNGIFVGGIEHKMGIHGSATCTLVLGADEPCRGVLIGKPNQGMRIMFHMMNEARMWVAVQGVAGASWAYQLSRSYAAERVQGTEISKMGDPTAQPVTIDRHPDVRRMLMWQKVHVQTMRSLLYSTVLHMDRAMGCNGSQREEHMGHVELLTPILKSYCSDRGYESAVLGLQVFGGAGYCADYPVEQVVRDLKIASIYEGTNGVQAMDLLGRKMRMGSGVLFMRWNAEVNAELERCDAHPELAGAVAAVRKARKALIESTMNIGQLGSVDKTMLYAMPFLDQFGCTVLAAHAVWQARVALEALPAASAEDVAFYKGKVLNAQFYCANVLPTAIGIGRTIRAADASCLAPEAFA